jgi:hypothetical protein
VAAFRYMVRNTVEDSMTTTSDSTTSLRPGPSWVFAKRPAGESALVAGCMEHKLRGLQLIGADENASEIIMQANPCRYLRYAQVQSKYLT